MHGAGVHLVAAAAAMGANAVLAVVLGCGPNKAQVQQATAPSDVVTVVNTHTPGVAFVVVRPDYDWRNPPPDIARFKREYILLCDARPVDGIHCDIPPEAAIQRISEHPRTGKAPAPIDLGIGSIGGQSPEGKDSGNQGQPNTGGGQK